MIYNAMLLSLALLFSVTPIAPKQAKRSQVQQPKQAQNVHHHRQHKQQNLPQPPRLSQYSFGAGSVLPVFTDQSGTTYAILSREAHGRDEGTYDDFGGKRDKGESHPLITCAREFYEEAIIDRTIGLPLKAIRDYIDIKKADNTQYIIANEKNVMYVVDFTAYADQFFDSFYTALRTTTNKHSREKNSIAVVEWNVLQKTIAQSKFNTGIKVDAFILDPSGQIWDVGYITLRGFFSKKSRPFFTNQPYQQGLDSKIRFYDMINPVATLIVGKAIVQSQKSAIRPRTIKAGNRRAWKDRLLRWMKS